MWQRENISLKKISHVISIKHIVLICTTKKIKAQLINFFSLVNVFSLHVKYLSAVYNMVALMDLEEIIFMLNGCPKRTTI